MSAPAHSVDPFAREERPRGLRRGVPGLTMRRIYERAWPAKDMAASLACLIVILAFERRAPRVAGVLIAEVGATIVVGLFDLAEPDGVSLAGPPPQGLPGFRIPTISYSELSSLLPASVSSSDT